MGSRFRVIAFMLLFLFIFLSFPIMHVYIKKLVLKFSQDLLKLEFWNFVYTWTVSCFLVGLRTRLIAYILLFIYPFFLSFQAKFVSQFPQELCKVESSNMVYICRMSNCIVGL